MLEVENLVKELPFKETAFSSSKYVKVIDDVSFRLKTGQTLGIVGESGCGKTTLANLCAGILKVSKGKIDLEGKDIYKRGRKDLSRVRQIIFQDALGSLNKRMTIGKIIEEPLIIHKVLDKEKRNLKLKAVMEKVGLKSSDIDKYPNELSGGEQQRVAIARAIIMQPKLLILDEPISSLDVSMQGQILNLLMDLQDTDNLTYIFIAHDLSMVRLISDTVAVMYLGKILEMSPTEDLFSHPWHPYTSLLISAIPVADPRIERKRTREILKGEVPEMLNRPKGCIFNNRCPEVKSICFKEIPELKEIAKNRLVACHMRKKRI